MRHLCVLVFVAMVVLFFCSCIHPDWKYGLPASKVHAAEVHYRLGGEHFQRADWKEAVVEYRKAEQLDPANAEIRLELSWALLWVDDWDGAIAEGRAALQLDPNSRKAPEAHHGIGIALEHKGDFCGALGEYRTAHLLVPLVFGPKTAYERVKKEHPECSDR